MRTHSDACEVTLPLDIAFTPSVNPTITGSVQQCGGAIHQNR